MTIANCNTLDLWERPRATKKEVTNSGGPTIVDDLPLGREISNDEIFVIRNCESRYLTHLFHKYAGKFIPHIPRWGMHRFLKRNEGKIVLDPFVGSGTTLVEAMLDGQRGYGLDVDPLARLISKVKTTNIAESRLSSLSREVTEALGQTDRGTFRPSIPTLSHWFTEKAIEDLSSIYSVVERYRNESDIHDFLVICFSSIIRRASNADNQTMKTYVSHTNPKKPEDARALFLKTVHGYADRLIKFGSLVQSNGRTKLIDNGDARDIDVLWFGNDLPPVDLAITSPPYIKSVDYVYNQMAELFWIGERWGLENQEKQNTFKRLYIGNDRPSKNKPVNLPILDDKCIDTYLLRIYEQNPHLGLVAFNYFSSMDRHFQGMKRILRPGAHYLMVVGDSTLAGVSVPTHTLLALCARRHGFRVLSQFAYEIRNKHMHFPRGGRGGEVSHDWVLNLSFS